MGTTTTTSVTTTMTTTATMTTGRLRVPGACLHYEVRGTGPIERDFTAIIGATLPVAALRDTTTRILPAAGRTTPRTVFDHRCAQELAGLLSTEIVEFPGGHNGNTTHPRGYAALLRRILRSPASAT